MVRRRKGEQDGRRTTRCYTRASNPRQPARSSSMRARTVNGKVPKLIWIPPLILNNDWKPGDIVPSGQCPACDCFCQPKTDQSPEGFLTPAKLAQMELLHVIHNLEAVLGFKLEDFMMDDLGGHSLSQAIEAYRTFH